MLRRRLTIPSGGPAALLAGALALAAFGCTDERIGAGPRPPNAPPTDPEIGEDAPINPAYVCGSRFVVTNAQSFPITVTYRVAESEEEGTAGCRLPRGSSVRGRRCFRTGGYSSPAVTSITTTASPIPPFSIR